jgi:hypothetical protein
VHQPYSPCRHQLLSKWRCRRKTPTKRVHVFDVWSRRDTNRSAHAAQSPKLQSLRKRKPLSISRNHTYIAGFRHGAGGGTVKRPLCNTVIIITRKDVHSTRVALTEQARAALHRASCSYTVCRKRDVGFVGFRSSVKDSVRASVRGSACQGQLESFQLTGAVQAFVTLQTIGQLF